MNIVVDAILREDEEDVKNESGELARTSLIMIILLLLFELQRNLIIFSIMIVLLLILSLIAARLDLDKIHKISEINRIISEKIFKIIVVLSPIYFIAIVATGMLK